MLVLTSAYIGNDDINDEIISRFILLNLEIIIKVILLKGLSVDLDEIDSLVKVECFAYKID